MAQPVSLAQQASAVLRMARLDAIKVTRARESEAKLLLEHLQAAAATLGDLAKKEPAK